VKYDCVWLVHYDCIVNKHLNINSSIKFSHLQQLLHKKMFEKNELLTNKSSNDSGLSYDYSKSALFKME